MSTGLKVLVACLSVFGVIMGGLMILGMLHWIVLGVVVVAIGYGVYKVATFGKKPLAIGDKDLHKQLKQMEKDLDTLRKR